MKSKYIGVYWSDTSQKWYARIRGNGKQLHLGVFESEIEAAKAYDEKAYELRGDNTKFNLRNNDHSCEASNCDRKAVTKFKGYWVCQKHKLQLKQNGKFLNRTIYDKNEVIIEGEYAYISLYDKQCNKVAVTKVDAKNVEEIEEYKWYLRPDGYVATNNYHGMYMYLHSLICNKNGKYYVDHIDRNKLNNTEENLRGADGSENQMNRGINSNNSSGKVGVHWCKDKQCWCAMIGVYHKRINLGYFENYDDAVLCRVNAENKYFQNYRALNEKEINEFVFSGNEEKGDV